MKKPTIGIIGNGFVGEAQAFAFSPVSDIKIYDIDPLKSTHNLKQHHDSDFVFVCVPTPQGDDGSCDTQIIKGVLQELHNKNYKGIVAIKSTPMPQIYEVELNSGELLYSDASGDYLFAGDLYQTTNSCLLNLSC